MIVASNEYYYYPWACMLMEEIKDWYPEAKICFVTEEKFLDGREKIADHLLIGPSHRRTKMWGMARSPFDKTFYMDADMNIIGPGIETVFDELEDNDLLFPQITPERMYMFNGGDFPGGEFKLCGACCLYNSSKPRVMQFMQYWFDLFVKQQAKEWWPTDEAGNWDTHNYPHENHIWDQFTLWWMTEKMPEWKDVKVSTFEKDYRWNYWALTDRTKEPLTDDVVVFHRSCQADREVYQPSSV